MNFSYQSTGRIDVFGCSDYELRHYRNYRYAIGSITFSKDKARNGIYEKVIIKSVRFPNQWVNLYTDIFNGIWTEDELLPYSNAKTLVDSYLTRRDQMIVQSGCIKNGNQ